MDFYNKKVGKATEKESPKQRVQGTRVSKTELVKSEGRVEQRNMPSPCVMAHGGGWMHSKGWGQRNLLQPVLMWGPESFHLGSNCGSFSSLFIVINRTTERYRQDLPKYVPWNMTSVGCYWIWLRKKRQLNSLQFNAFIEHPQQDCKLQIQPRAIQAKPLRAYGLMVK